MDVRRIRQRRRGSEPGIPGLLQWAYVKGIRESMSTHRILIDSSIFISPSAHGESPLGPRETASTISSRHSGGTCNVPHVPRPAEREPAHRADRQGRAGWAQADHPKEAGGGGTRLKEVEES